MSVAPPMPAARLAGVASSPVREILALTARDDVVSFAGGLPAPELFDVDGLRAAFDTVLGSAGHGGHSGRSALQYSTTEGDPSLRQAIAHRLSRRGLTTGPDELLITSGSQQALTLVATTLLDPGDVVLVEQPSYLAALQCFQLTGARLVPIPGDEQGIDPGALDELVRRERPTALYLVPSFQNPTGRTVPADRRTAIAELATRHGFWIIEDNPYGELRYSGDALPDLAVHAPGHVLSLGSFSKIMAPGLRLGWMRTPADVRKPMVIAKQAADLHTSTVTQAAVVEYLHTRDLDAHITRIREVYRDRRDAMLAALPGVLPPGSTWTTPDGGMFVWVRLPDGHDATRLLPRALDEGVAFVPGAPFYATDPEHGTLRLSFTTHPPAEITTGLRRLGDALAH